MFLPSQPIFSHFAQKLMSQPLLTGKEEQQLVRQYQLSLTVAAAETEFKEEHGRMPSDEELAKQFEVPAAELKLVRHNGQQAINLLISSNMKLILSLAKPYENKGVARTILLAAGSKGENYIALTFFV